MAFGPGVFFAHSVTVPIRNVFKITKTTSTNQLHHFQVAVPIVRCNFRLVCSDDGAEAYNWHWHVIGEKS